MLGAGTHFICLDVIFTIFSSTEAILLCIFTYLFYRDYNWTMNDVYEVLHFQVMKISHNIFICD